MAKPRDKNISFDDLLDAKDSEVLGISIEALEDLKRLDAPKAIDFGTPIAIVIFWSRYHCQCGGFFEAPTHNCGAMLKRQFNSKKMTEYTPLQNPLAFPKLPREQETRIITLNSCPRCALKRNYPMVIIPQTPVGEASQKNIPTVSEAIQSLFQDTIFLRPQAD